MGNTLEGDNVWIKYRSVSSSLMSDIPSSVFVCSHKEAAYLPEYNEA